jgi:hypothetical protein
LPSVLMENVLPKFKSFTLSSEGVHHPSQWRPHSAVVATAPPKQAPPKNFQTTHYDTNILPPNERYQKVIHDLDDVSPLSASERSFLCTIFL